MYHKLARGYATQFVNQQLDHPKLDAWMNSNARRRALTVLEESSRSKKPGRVSKRLHQVIRPHFSLPKLVRWNKQTKILFSESITSAQENAVFSLSDIDRALYTERSVFLSNLILKCDEVEVMAMLASTANISHHALTRLFEREVATDANIAEHVKLILSIIRNISIWLDRTDIKFDRSHSFLIPYMGGALPAVTMEVLPNSSDPASRRRVIAIRTFLDKEMLIQDHHDRMGGFDDAYEHSAMHPGSDAMPRWIQANARPFDLLSRSEREEINMPGGQPASMSAE